MVERLQFKVGIAGQGTSRGTKVMTLQDFVEWLATQPYTEDVKKTLVEKARGYPVGTLANFVRNIKTHLETLYDG